MTDGRETPATRKARLLAHLQEVARERDPESAPAGHAYVADYIPRTLAQHGTPRMHLFPHRGRTHENIILDLPGRDEEGLVLVGAHYDGVAGRRRQRLRARGPAGARPRLRGSAATAGHQSRRLRS